MGVYWEMRLAVGLMALGAGRISDDEVNDGTAVAHFAAGRFPGGLGIAEDLESSDEGLFV
jgi:hypothetical protein